MERGEQRLERDPPRLGEPDPFRNPGKAGGGSFTPSGIQHKMVGRPECLEGHPFRLDKPLARGSGSDVGALGTLTKPPFFKAVFFVEPCKEFSMPGRG